MSSGPVLERLNALIEQGERIRSFQFPEREGVLYQLGTSNRARLREWKDSCLGLIGDAAGEDSELFRAFPFERPDHMQDTFHEAMDHYLSILRMLRDISEELGAKDFTRGDGSASIVHGARRLLEAGHKDAAAIYCRVALEVSLRSLCVRGGVGFEEGDSINKMAKGLREASVIGQDEWRAIQRWATLVNAAAYQRFSQVKPEKVRDMVDWLGHFSGEDRLMGQVEHAERATISA